MEFVRLYLLVSLAVFGLFAPLMLIFYRSSRRTSTIRFSNTAGARRAASGGVRKKARHLLPILRLLALALFLTAFARPRSGEEITEVHTKGVAIQMVLDRSGSMQEKFSTGSGGSVTRFQAVKKVFTDFVNGGNGFAGRPADMIGLTSFARFVEENCPLTLDHDNLAGFVESSDIATGAEDGTAIGDAIYHASLGLIAVEDLLEEAAVAGEEYHIESRVLILLTDGKQNAGEFEPAEAAEFAKENDIRIYTIAVGGRESFKSVDRLLGGAFQFFTGERIDTRPLERVARITGGEFAKAESASELRRIYERIDELEKTPFQHKFVRYKEHFQKFTAAGLLLILFEQILAATWLRRIP